MSASVAVLYFTDGLEAEASIQSATEVKDVLGKQAFAVALTESDWVDRVNALASGTLCFLASHGGLGEDGTLQSYLEAIAVPHTHSAASTSSTLANKHLTKFTYQALGIPTPPWAFIGNTYGGDSVQHPLKKTVFGGGKQGIQDVTHIAHDGRHIYEEIIPGNLEVAVPVLRSGRDHIPLSPVVRERSTTEWGELRDLENGAVPASTRQLCQDYAQKLSRALDCYGVTKTDFVIDDNGKAWALETDVIPGLRQVNAASEAAKNAGIGYEELLHKIMETVWRPTR